MARRVVLYVLYALVVVGLLLAIVAAFRQSPNKKPTSTATQSQPAKKPAQTQPQNKSTGTNSGQSSPSTTGNSSGSTQPNSSSSTGSQAQNSTNKSTSNQQLSNSGPGDVIAMFVIVTGMAGVWFSWWQRRQIQA